MQQTASTFMRSKAVTAQCSLDCVCPQPEHTRIHLCQQSPFRPLRSPLLSPSSQVSSLRIQVCKHNAQSVFSGWVSFSNNDVPKCHREAVTRLWDLRGNKTCLPIVLWYITSGAMKQWFKIKALHIGYWNSFSLGSHFISNGTCHANVFKMSLNQAFY